ncbi:MAG: radical SAM protein [Candidatus Firestonebacteria bacterium]
MKALLVDASITACGFKSYRTGELMESSWIHHGLCSISAYAKQAGYEVSFIDLRLLAGFEEFKSEIKKRNPAAVGLSMMSVDFNAVMKCADLIKEVDRSIKVIVGGPHPSINANEVSVNPNIDHIVLGEGEITFTEILNGLSAGKPLERVIRGVPPVLDKIPFADRELYSGPEAPILAELPEPFMTVIAARGCIYNCSFCQPAEKIIFGKGLRRRSVQSLIAELEVLRKKYGLKSLMIHDDCFTEDMEYVAEFCREYTGRGFKMPFVCQSRADIICRNEETVKKMKDAGLFMFIIGFESGSQRVLNFLRKGTKVEHNFQAAEICRKYGIKVWANYMLGIPSETKEEALDTVNMIKKIKPDHYSPAFFTPHPGSDLFNYCEKNGLSLVKSHEEYRRSPFGQKVKGIDYKFLNRALQESLGKKSCGAFSMLRMHTAAALKKTASGRYLVEAVKKAVRRVK